MNCPDCQRAMQLCYTEHYCVWCNSAIEDLKFYPGFAVIKNDGMHSPFYVFRHITEARKWKREMGLKSESVQKVLSPQPFTWTRSKGIVTSRIVANRLFLLSDDHKFVPEEPYVFLASMRRRKKATPMGPAEEEETEGDRLSEFFASSLNR